MDKERRKKLQTTKLVITEIFMLVIIVLTVVILTFVVMGYRLTEDGKLEQSGLIQVDSIPTGAKVTIGEETLSSETNTSKVLPEGEYEVKLKKDGYTSWHKTVRVHSGFLTKLSYPRLYKTERKTETMQKLSSAPLIYSVSPSRESILLAESGSSKFQLLNISSEAIKTNDIDLSKLLLSKGELPTNPKVISWSEDANRLILSYDHTDGTHLAIVDLERPESSFDLTSYFGLKISTLHFRDRRGDKLFILENGNLRTASFADKQLSNVLISNILSFSNSGPKIALVRQLQDGGKEFAIINEDATSDISLSKTTATYAEIILSEYIGRPTLVLAEDTKIKIYRGELPTEDISAQNPLPKPVGEIDLAFGEPSVLEMRAKEQILLASKNTDFTIFDLENYTPSSFSLSSALTFWPDEYTIGLISDGHLTVRDFDGTNVETLSKAEPGYDAVITKDNKYLYFVQKDSEDNLTIVRENIK